MTIGKRKGYTAKGTGAEPGQDATKKVGGSLSKNDHWYLQQAFGTSFDPGAASLPGIEATGGDIKDYQSPDTIDPASGQGQWYRSHTFRTSGAFTVTELGVRGGNIDYVIVAGGGGGGNCWGPGHNAAGGGAGAGGLLSATNVNMSNGTYPVAIGGGGLGQEGMNSWGGANGSDSTLAYSGAPQVAVGGGAGGAGDPAPTNAGNPGGSGGGGWYTTGQPNKGNGTQADTPLGTGYGNDGSPGQGSPEYGGAGGGSGGAGGFGTVIGPGTVNTYRYGGSTPQTYGAGGQASDYASTNRQAAGAANSGNGSSAIAAGGSGIVVVRYVSGG